jgi:Phage-like element PBSX protein XtrA
MRLNEIEVNPSTQKIEIDLMDNSSAFMIVVCNGKARMTDLPVHGETKVVTYQGKVKRVKWDEGEDF